MKKLTSFLFLLCFILSLLLLFFQPYKEILICNQADCSVKRYYIFKYKNYTYYVSRNDIYYSKRYAPKTGVFYHIDDRSNPFDSVFINGFKFKSDAQKITNTLKSNNINIKITKYWIGYKIEN